MTTKEKLIIQKADNYCLNNGFNKVSTIGALEVYFMRQEVLITKPVDPIEASRYDGLYGDGATMPKTVLIYLQDQDRFETTDHTEKYLKKAS